MQIVRDLAGYSYGRSDLVRRGCNRADHVHRNPCRVSPLEQLGNGSVAGDAAAVEFADRLRSFQRDFIGINVRMGIDDRDVHKGNLFAGEICKLLQ